MLLSCVENMEVLPLFYKGFATEYLDKAGMPSTSQSIPVLGDGIFLRLLFELQGRSNPLNTHQQQQKN